MNRKKTPTQKPNEKISDLIWRLVLTEDSFGSGKTGPNPNLILVSYLYGLGTGEPRKLAETLPDPWNIVVNSLYIIVLFVLIIVSVTRLLFGKVQTKNQKVKDFDKRYKSVIKD